MNKFEAEKIVKSYGAALAKGTEEGYIRRKSNLPCSKAQIKQAYFIYIKAIINDFKLLSKEVRENLVGTYSAMNSFIDDDEADEMIKITKLMKAKKLNVNNPSDKEKQDKFFAYAKKIIGYELFNEIDEYIGECYKKAGIG